MKDWQPIASATFDRDIQVSVIAKSARARRTASADAERTVKQLFIHPARWREWPAD
jgi:hypothetical protein